MSAERPDEADGISDDSVPLPQFDDLVWDCGPSASLAERWEMIQELTIEAYARIGIDVRDMPMRRDLMRVIRRS